MSTTITVVPWRPRVTTRSSTSGAISGDSITVITSPDGRPLSGRPGTRAPPRPSSAVDPGPACRGSGGAGRVRFPASTDEVTPPPSVRKRHPLAAGCIVLGDRPSGAHRTVEAGRQTVDPFADSEVVGRVDDQRDVGVEIGPRRIHLQFARTRRSGPVDPSEAVAGTERADRGELVALAGPSRSVEADEPVGRAHCCADVEQGRQRQGRHRALGRRRRPAKRRPGPGRGDANTFHRPGTPAGGSQTDREVRDAVGRPLS